MNVKNKARRTVSSLLAVLLVFLAGCASTGGGGGSSTVDIAIFASSDIHNYYLDYDYFTDLPTEQNGLVRLASAMIEERKTNPNVLYFDNGDFIQGNPFGEYLSKNPPQKGAISPIMTLLNALKTDAMTTGNHEFNFGLPYLDTVIKGAKFPVVCANVVKAGTEEPYFRPYAILNRTFLDTAGKRQRIKIGVLGLTPPQIITWDGSLLQGKVETRDGYETAKRYIPEIKAAGADIIVVLAHSGLVDFPHKGGEENFGYYISEIPGVDVLITGHVHQKFPSSAYTSLAGADIEKGTVNGIPTVMPGSFADTLGLVNLRLTRQDGTWKREDGGSRLLPLYDAAAKKSNYPADSGLSSLLAKEHEAVLAYIRSPVGSEEGGATAGGSLTAPLNSFFSVVRDDYTVQIINEAQIYYAREVLAGTEYAALPILSAAAPFKAGGRQGPKYYTNIPAGPLAIKNIADLYVYSNTVVILKLNGAEVKEWLEMSAGQFNQVNPRSQEAQYLINDDFPTYLFDVIDGVSYKIDITQPARYNPNGSMRDQASERIKDLRFQDKPIDPAQEFAVVSNNYRSYGGGNFPNVGPAKIILASPDESRQVILKYMELKQEIVPQWDDNWSLALPSGSGPLLFLSSPQAQDFLLPGISYEGTNEAGYGIYRIQP
ncbi:2',3'-cyclic-nucleotide 2'-phosphodiesterase [Treponema primitia ZAS-2]|uniref:2',3'-cyclic-nucleotide 2'-phosphodiesterase n=1 Tax=Treponema primitia (strain ATCC BAA-887 / DSM 12427 / ZAS-2) TaxID=545694 RepID=F5YMS8_TREPZ|nr:bifunctional 2',3'-cyclic-nucleotide 2'-phosphodiesterase/3'-nucleotidase [Treponema primitia]AEF84081.1 2',3'-cyclic-nucleotide 2'-phosphodiesterase [Treponema primitia ZAS-2]